MGFKIYEFTDFMYWVLETTDISFNDILEYSIYYQNLLSYNDNLLLLKDNIQENKQIRG